MDSESLLFPSLTVLIKIEHKRAQISNLIKDTYSKKMTFRNEIENNFTHIEITSLSSWFIFESGFEYSQTTRSRHRFPRSV